MSAAVIITEAELAALPDRAIIIGGRGLIRIATDLSGTRIFVSKWGGSSTTPPPLPVTVHMGEPTKLYSTVRDAAGEIWMRGRRWWHQQDGPGKLVWSNLVWEYGPLGVDAETERRQALGILGGRARD